MRYVPLTIVPPMGLGAPFADSWNVMPGAGARSLQMSEPSIPASIPSSGTLGTDAASHVVASLAAASAPPSAPAPHDDAQLLTKQEPRFCTARSFTPAAIKGPTHPLADASVVASPRFARHSSADTAAALHVQSAAHAPVEPEHELCRHDSHKPPVPASSNVETLTPTASQGALASAGAPHAVSHFESRHVPRSLRVVSVELSSGATQADSEAIDTLAPRFSMHCRAWTAVSLQAHAIEQELTSWPHRVSMHVLQAPVPPAVRLTLSVASMGVQAASAAPGPEDDEELHAANRPMTTAHAKQGASARSIARHSRSLRYLDRYCRLDELPILIRTCRAETRRTYSGVRGVAQRPPSRGPRA